jgi:hypothetical protein
MLEHFNLLTLESKCLVYEFYNSLQWGTDNMGISLVQVSLDLTSSAVFVSDTNIAGVVQGVPVF